MTEKYAFLFLFAVLSQLNPTLACNGYGIKINHYKNCVDNPVIKLPTKGVSVVLDSDCNISLGGCLEIVRPFKTAKGTYTLKKAPLPTMEGELDFCESVADLDDPGIGKIAAMYGMPKQCPIPARKLCGQPNKKISIAQYKNQIGMAAGTTEIKLEAVHDTGKTCIDLSLTISRAKRG